MIRKSRVESKFLWRQTLTKNTQPVHSRAFEEYRCKLRNVAESSALCLTSSLLRAVWCGHKCASLGPEVLIKTQTKMIAAGSAEEACECLSVLRSTASQCPGVGEIWSPWAWDRLYYLLSGRLAQEIARRRDGRLGNRIRYVLLWCQRLSWCHLIFACVGIRADNLILMKTGTVH